MVTRIRCSLSGGNENGSGARTANAGCEDCSRVAYQSRRKLQPLPCVRVPLRHSRLIPQSISASDRCPWPPNPGRRPERRA
ncbi:hypothetical protein [Lysobacter gummosus]|uniref:hypothetical protein n=1 Tax=Lysobacter gummosus TaxID=262324 RepID=UPI00363B34F6